LASGATFAAGTRAGAHAARTPHEDIRMNQPHEPREPQRSAAAPTGDDPVERVAERQQRDAGERVAQAVDNQGAQGRRADPPPGAPSGRPRGR
jgi:hypothetical protein